MTPYSRPYTRDQLILTKVNGFSPPENDPAANWSPGVDAGAWVLVVVIRVALVAITVALVWAWTY